MRSPRSLWIAIAIAVLALQLRVVIGRRTFDHVRYHTEVAPPRLAAASAIARGAWPGWWDGAGFGVPLAAEPTHGAGYPPVWLAWSPRALDLLVVAHLWWLALGVALWARRRGASDLAAGVAGVAVAASGIAAGCATDGSLFALAHLPWLAVVAGRPALVGALVGAVGLTGDLGALVDAVALAVVVSERGILRTLPAVGAGLAIAAVQWLPAAYVLAHEAGAPLHGISAPALALVSSAGLLLGVRHFLRREKGSDPILAVAAAVLAVAWRGPGWLGSPHVHLGLCAVILGVAAARAIDGLGETWRRRAIGIAVVLAPALGMLPWTWPTASRALVEDAPAWARAGSELVGPQRMARTIRDAQPRTLDDAVATLAGGIGARWGLALARTSDPARPEVQDRVWLGATHMAGELLQRFGVSIAVLPDAMAASPRVVLLARHDEAIIAQLSTGDPPAAVFANWIWLADEHAAIEALFPPGTHPARVRRLVLSGDGVPNEDEPPEAVPCAIAAWTPGTIDLSCTAERDAYAAVTSAPAAGWSVTIDGHTAPWITADLLRRAVALPAGTHRIAWRYTPPGLGAGAVLALLGAITLVGLGVLAVLRARQRSVPSS